MRSPRGGPVLQEFRLPSPEAFWLFPLSPGMPQSVLEAVPTGCSVFCTEVHLMVIRNSSKTLPCITISSVACPRTCCRQILPGGIWLLLRPKPRPHGRSFLCSFLLLLKSVILFCPILPSKKSSLLMCSLSPKGLHFCSLTPSPKGHVVVVLSLS